MTEVGIKCAVKLLLFNLHLRWPKHVLLPAEFKFTVYSIVVCILELVQDWKFFWILWLIFKGWIFWRSDMCALVVFTVWGLSQKQENVTFCFLTIWRENCLLARDSSKQICKIHKWALLPRASAVKNLNFAKLILIF